MRYKDLCLDAVDAEASGRFWAAALGLRLERRGDHVVLLDGVDEHTVWVNQVAEPVTVKQRVHLDLHVGAVAELVALGATVLDDTLPWTLMRDPEGGELCAFVRQPPALPSYRLYEVVVDAVDHRAAADWWGSVFGVAAEHDEQPFSGLSAVPGMPFELVFQSVPEPKTVKNRVHWDLWGDTADLLAAGARLLRAVDQETDWDVLADPEGNEFCVFRPTG